MTDLKKAMPFLWLPVFSVAVVTSLFLLPTTNAGPAVAVDRSHQEPGPPASIDDRQARQFNPVPVLQMLDNNAGDFIQNPSKPKLTPDSILRFQEFFDDDHGLDLGGVIDYLPEGLPLSPPGGSLFPGAPELDSLVVPQTAGLLGFPISGGFGLHGGFPGFSNGFFRSGSDTAGLKQDDSNEANQGLLDEFGVLVPDSINTLVSSPFSTASNPLASIDKKPAFINKPLTSPTAVAQLHLAESLIQEALRPPQNKPNLIRPPVFLGPPKLSQATYNALLTIHGIHPNLLPTRPEDDYDESPSHPIVLANPLGHNVVPVTAPVRPGFPFAPTFTYYPPSVAEILVEVDKVLAGGVLGTDVVRAGPKPLLAQPDPAACATRRGDFQFGPNGYQFSWLQPGAPTRDWFNARNYCRRQCMDLVSLETPEENEAIRKILNAAWVQGLVPYVWTSGRMCDFGGCDRPDLQPLEIEGWFWTASGAKLYYPGRGFSNWGASQPDNREKVESCVAFLNPSIFNDPSGQFTWHDVGCHYQKPFVCEDNDRLIQYAAQLREASSNNKIQEVAMTSDSARRTVSRNETTISP